jgi:hypothetical protein
MAPGSSRTQNKNAASSVPPHFFSANRDTYPTPPKLMQSYYALSHLASYVLVIWLDPGAL